MIEPDRTDPTAVNLWSDREHALAYLRERDGIPHRSDAYEMMLELLPEKVTCVLDLGCGDGECMALIKAVRPEARGYALDFSPEMLDRARHRLAPLENIAVVEHDLDDRLPAEIGAEHFDLIVSASAIHHLDDVRKRSLYAELFDRLTPGGVFVNVEHVASPTPGLHVEFLAALGRAPAEDDPSNQLVAVEAQLQWLREIGFLDVDCYWKWRELAVLAGRKAA